MSEWTFAVDHDGDTGEPIGVYEVDVGDREQNFTTTHGAVFVNGKSTTPVTAIDARRLLVVWPRAKARRLPGAVVPAAPQGTAALPPVPAPPKAQKPPREARGAR